MAEHREDAALGALRAQRAKWDDWARRTGRQDSWYNVKSRFGGRADPVIQTQFVRSRGRITRSEAEDLYQFDWLTARGVEQLPKDATREWITLTHDKKPEVAERLRREDLRLDGRGRFRESMQWARLHGGSLLVVGSWDGQDPEEPLNEGGIKGTAFTNVVDRWLAFPTSFYRDEADEKFGQVETYRVHRLSIVGSPTSVVHESRVIRFDGDPLPPLARTRNFGWAGSAIDRVFDTLRNYGISSQAAASVIPSFITFAVKVGNLQQLLASKDWEAIRARLAEFHAQMATHNLALYGEGESIEKMGTPIEGLPALMDKFMEQISGAWNIPKSILFQAETGKLGGNAAGSDQENWYNDVASEQETMVRPRARRWLDLIGIPLGIEPGEVEFEFNELTQMSDATKADLYAKVTTADETAIRSGTVDSPERLGVFRFGGNKFNAGPPVFDTDRQERFLEGLDREEIETPEREQGLGDEGPEDREDDGTRLDDLMTGPQRDALSEKIAQLMREGKPQAQAVAIAHSMLGIERKDDGGEELDITTR